MGTILALIAIIMGLIVGVIDEKVLFDSLTWFVLALALEFLGLPAWGPFVRREP